MEEPTVESVYAQAQGIWALDLVMRREAIGLTAAALRGDERAQRLLAIVNPVCTVLINTGLPCVFCQRHIYVQDVGAIASWTAATGATDAIILAICEDCLDPDPAKMMTRLEQEARGWLPDLRPLMVHEDVGHA